MPFPRRAVDRTEDRRAAALRQEPRRRSAEAAGAARHPCHLVAPFHHVTAMPATRSAWLREAAATSFRDVYRRRPVAPGSQKHCDGVGRHFGHRKRWVDITEAQVSGDSRRFLQFCPTAHPSKQRILHHRPFAVLNKHIVQRLNRKRL